LIYKIYEFIIFSFFLKHFKLKRIDNLILQKSSAANSKLYIEEQLDLKAPVTWSNLPDYEAIAECQNLETSISSCFKNKNLSRNRQHANAFKRQNDTRYCVASVNDEPLFFPEKAFSKSENFCKNFAKGKDNIKNIVLDCKAVKNSQETSMLVPLTNEKLNFTLNINNLPLIRNNLLNEMANKPILSGTEKTVLSTINQSANCYTTDKLNKNKNLTKTKKKIIKKILF